LNSVRKKEKRKTDHLSTLPIQEGGDKEGKKKGKIKASNIYAHDTKAKKKDKSRFRLHLFPLDISGTRKEKCGESTTLAVGPHKGGGG